MFESASDAELHLEGWVEAGSEGGFDAHLRVSRGATPLGTRVLRASQADCSDLTRQLLLVIALLLDPDRSWLGQFPEVFADVPASPGAVLLNSMPDPALEQPASEPLGVQPARTEVPQGPGDADEVRPPITEEPAQATQRARRWAVAAMMGPGYGGTDGLTFWVEPSLRVRLREAWWLRAALPIWTPNSPDFEDATPLMSGLGARLEACRRLYQRPRARLAACLGAGATVIRLFGAYGDRWTASPNLSGQFLFEGDFSRWGLFVAAVGLQGNLRRVSAVERLPDDEARVVFTQLPVGVWGGAGLGARF